MIPYALILTHNRHEMVGNLINKMVEDQTQTFVIDHNSEPAVCSDHPRPTPFLIRKVTDYQGESFNIHKLWNLGLGWVDRYHAHSGNKDLEYSVTVFNDDADPSRNFCQEAASLMEDLDVDIVSPSLCGQDLLYTNRGAISLAMRPAGWCWTVRGGSILPDERFKVWYGDDDLWQQALRSRGFMLTTRITCGNLDADGNFTRNPWWQEQAGRDREAFFAKWGYYPW